MGDDKPTALEVKYHPTLTDAQKLRRITEKNGIAKKWLVGKFHAPGYNEFLWGGLIFKRPIGAGFTLTPVYSFFTSTPLR